MTKKEPTEKIQSIKKGAIDQSANKIVNVLASGNEYSIYEIETDIPENRLRVLIDGFDEASENILIEKFNYVKQNYITAKSLLYRSSNYNLMKNRVAHSLATIFTSNIQDPNKIFTDLIEEIRKEYKTILWRKTVFLLPCYLFLLILGVNFLINSYHSNYLGSEIITNLLKFITATCIGAVFSITSTSNKIRFEVEPNTLYYILIGVERLILAILSGIILFIAIRTKILFSETINTNIYLTLFLGFISGFSETFIPNLLNKKIQDI